MDKNLILDFFKEVSLDEKTHTYTYKGKKSNLSVSKILKDFQETFDRDGISKRVAEKRGISQKEVLAEWDSKRDKSCRLGTIAHKFGEHYPFDRKLEPVTGYEKAIVSFWKSLPDHVIPVTMELEMYHKKYDFFGTGDILLYNSLTGNYIIGDYKTNEDLFKNYKNKKMKGLMSNFLDNPFNKYQCQLSLYQILFEQTGLKVSKRKIIWVKEDGTFTIYDTQDLTKELIKHLEKNYT